MEMHQRSRNVQSSVASQNRPLSILIVFDGSQAERKKRKTGAGVNVAKTAAKLLAAQLRAAALEQASRRSAPRSHSA